MPPPQPFPLSRQCPLAAGPLVLNDTALTYPSAPAHTRCRSSYPQTMEASGTHSPFRSLPRNTQLAPQSVFPSTLPSPTQNTTTTGTHARSLHAALPHQTRSSHKETRPSASGLPSTTVGYTPQGYSALTFSNQPASKAALIATKFTHRVGCAAMKTIVKTAPMLLLPPLLLIAVTWTPLIWGQGQGWWHMSCGGIACS